MQPITPCVEAGLLCFYSVRPNDIRSANARAAAFIWNRPITRVPPMGWHIVYRNTSKVDEQRLGRGWGGWPGISLVLGNLAPRGTI
jgi:hypothetical protein